MPKQGEQQRHGNDKAPLVAKRLMSKGMFSGWGIRTLATDMGAYNPVSYQRISVATRQIAIIVAGFLRYGFKEHVQRISTALLEAAEYSDGRLPELFCGFDGEHFDEPGCFSHGLGHHPDHADQDIDGLLPGRGGSGWTPLSPNPVVTFTSPMRQWPTAGSRLTSPGPVYGWKDCLRVCGCV